MTVAVRAPVRMNWIVLVFVTALASVAAQPAQADYTRGCTAEYVIGPSSFDGNAVRRSFRGEAAHPFGPNGARRSAG
jgi:hypothetical protein